MADDPRPGEKTVPMKPVTPAKLIIVNRRWLGVLSGANIVTLLAVVALAWMAISQDSRVARIEGRVGPPGKAGAPGAVVPGTVVVRGGVGPKGDPGDPGGPGRPGRDGADGTDGARGPRGARGRRGAVGPEGQRGPQGQQGTQGPRGPVGIPAPLPPVVCQLVPQLC